MIEKFKSLEPKQKNILEIFLIIGLVILVFTINLISKVIDAKKEQIESMKTVLVTDNSLYFTVLGCAKKFLTTLQSGNKSDIILSMDEEYITQNRITEANVLSYVPTLNRTSVYDYIGEEMYEHRISKNVTTYYIKGKIANSIMDESSTYTRYDMTITLFENTFTFTVKPGIGDLDYEE